MSKMILFVGGNIRKRHKYRKVQEESSVKDEQSLSFDSEILLTFALATCLKLLLIPTYHSTDLEVHRNWLAITHSLPIEEWYVDATSRWTLDYPPFFAWFEHLLGHLAMFFDSEMLKVDNLNYASPAAKLFQRITVVVADLAFVYGVREMGKTFCKSKSSFMILTFLSLFNVGLLVVDHVHFQYNGFLLGILLLSVARVSKTLAQGRVLEGAFWFAVLLNLKHIYVYVAPAYVVWLLRWYCAKDGQFFIKTFKLGGVVLIVTALSFGPFAKQLPEVLSRLFPFKRGLVHAYWAANAWALYSGADKILSIVWKRLGWLEKIKVASMTGGLVREDTFTVLPTPAPAITFVVTIASMLPALWVLSTRKESNVDSRHFVRCVVLCALSSFVFGWHVHEKAILTAVIPLCAVAGTDGYEARVFMILSSAGHTALLPLLHPVELTPLKMILSLTYMLSVALALTRRFEGPILTKYEWLYVGTLPLLTLYEAVLHKTLFLERLPFLPLAITSIYCAVGVTYSWLLYYYIFLFDRRTELKGDRIREIAAKRKKRKRRRTYEK